ncbi:MAG: YncE family protein [Chitinophagaceae bacterium]|jgi:DNA-binding beta-propeller fold protein YncE|nr:YncE family protein [Chitinophagaceae bacterium]
MYKLSLVATFAMVLLFSSVADAQQKTILALSKGDHVLAIINPSDLKIKARIPVGNDPHEVVASSDGATAFVSITYGGSSLHEIDVIDLVKQQRLPDINITPFSTPHGLDFAEGKLYFTAEGSRAVGCYNPAAKQLDWCMGTGEDRTHMVYVTADAKKIFTTNVNAGTVSIFQDTLMTPSFGPPPPNAQGKPATPSPQGGQSPFKPRPQKTWLYTVVPVARGAEGFDVSPDGKELWTAAADDGTIFIIDINAKKVSGTADVKAAGANRLKFTPDGKLVLVSSLRTGDLFVIDAAKRSPVKQLNVGKGCAGILIDTDNKTAYIACTPDNYIAVVNLQTLTVTAKIPLAAPDGLAWAK